MGKVFALIGRRKGKVIFTTLYSNREKAEIKKEAFESVDRKNRETEWTYEVKEEKVWD
jgi:hypothetical protein